MAGKPLEFQANLFFGKENLEWRIVRSSDLSIILADEGNGSNPK